ncbi:DUF4369 domain-containing protein [Flavobacterium rhizosphaerae]|uniref:DUF4369 domain-containing protein n=1 Tax=Flavobacterium rhizosphaerae TaxID=3163298 RepID=A0ABW8YUD3_9FLAO
MKKLLPILFALVLCACNDEKKDAPQGKNLHISGTVKGLRKGTLYIKKIEDTTFVTLDSIVIDGNPDFESYLNIESPEMYYLFLNRGETNSMDDKLLFFAEPGDIHIDTRLDGFFAKAKITGSENQKLYEQYLKLKSRYTDKNLDLIKLSAETSDPKKLDSLDKQHVSLLKRHYLYTVNFAVNNASHEVGPYVAVSELPDAGVAGLQYMDTICKSMTPKVANSAYGQLLKKYVDQLKEEQQEKASIN